MIASSAVRLADQTKLEHFIAYADRFLGKLNLEQESSFFNSRSEVGVHRKRTFMNTDPALSSDDCSIACDSVDILEDSESSIEIEFREQTRETEDPPKRKAPTALPPVPLPSGRLRSRSSSAIKIPLSREADSGGGKGGLEGGGARDDEKGE